MEVVLALMMQLLKLCIIIIIGFVVATQGSRGPLSPPASAPTPQKSKETKPFISPSSSSIALSPQYEVVPSPTTLQGNMPPSVAPAAQKARQLHHAPQPLTSAHSPALTPSVSNYKHHHTRNIDRAIPPSISPTTGRQRHHVPPRVSPPGSSSKTLPHPPPNEDCLSTVCTEPYVISPPGAPCRCVWPIRVGLRLSLSLYTFFPLVSELASELASGIFMKQSQVTIVGANAANQQPDKTVVLIDLVPLGEKFDNATAFLTSHRFWRKKVVIKASYFGNYDVLYLNYPGLPPSPPLPPSSITIIDGGPYTTGGNNGGTIKPIGVDIQKRQKRGDLSRGFIAIIAISVFVAVVLCPAAAWFMFKFKVPVTHPASTPWLSYPSLTKAPGTAGSLTGDERVDSVSSSFESGMAAYKASVKTFSMNDIEKATDNFDSSRILGEGGFGIVFGGVLGNGTKVAVKVLKKRDDLHSNHEFLSEVEMLSRLHHRNLVKLIGICTEEDSFRCLVYELVTNASLESHLHGVDREKCALDWRARMKIALGAARGLAYLHEDSSPSVIHRDFKSSNILLEDDFTPKVSDFGLARTAVDEENRHISTRVVGTFGYVAPEYAMNGHLLVKSDVYSYGVVLLELLTGRKPIDMSQTPGQENLVAWSRQFLTSNKGLEAIIDPSIGLDAPFDSVAKVAAIASMCVEPEVSNRPFMSEVVQALKLVCSECEEEEAKEDDGSRSYSQELEDLSVVDNDIENGLSASELFSSSARIGRMEYETFRRKSYSGPMGNGRSKQLWQIMRRLSGGSVSDHGTI
ncbi:receptor-like serine/threonine-protein kinase ALE2 isoform X2 [Lathyrus oleraceus]|uniref:Protein kinase domain-containing protein n=1 Tax=Pisum sativum TaxID=3888 RepID=A0A9D5AN70_PEA|nr:receptor-like serine/threonine-protein kinase ALE2 isoform X2 [Pisum sativum]KAI5415163.1 hypothetical protein KIW84_040568 [Pisum sativum]